MSDWSVIWKDAVEGVAGAIVYEKSHEDSLGKYTVAKSMVDGRGRFLSRQKYYKRKGPAIDYAVRFLENRARMVGKKFIPGGGKNTLLFQPLPGQFVG
jgi:hypothetical protein